MKKFYLAFGLMLSLAFAVQAQTTIRESLEWSAAPATVQGPEGEYQQWSFKGGAIGERYPGVPFYSAEIPVSGPGSLRVTVLDARYEDLPWQGAPGQSAIGSDLRFETRVERDRRQFSGIVAFTPIVRDGDRYRRLVDFTLQVTLIPDQAGAPRGPVYAETSALADGDIYKIAVAENGVYKLTYDFLKKDLGIENLDQIDPRTIKILGNGGGMVPAYSVADRLDDLQENRIAVQGEGDGKFDSGDYILFYAEGPDKWTFDPDARTFTMQKNIHDARNYYFIKISSGNGLRVEARNNIQAPEFSSTQFSDYRRVEEDRQNLLYDWTTTRMGAGQDWFGDWFKTAREYSYKNLFTFPNIATGEPAEVRVEMVLRANVSSRFQVQVNAGSNLQSSLASSTRVGTSSDYTDSYANRAAVNTNVTLSQDNVDFKVAYPVPAGASQETEGWLDFIQVTARRKLIMTGDQMAFRDPAALDYGNATYNLQQAADGILIWDITNPLSPLSQQAQRSGTTLSYGVANTGELQQFLAFNPAQTLLKAEAVGKIPNQNLHRLGLSPVDMVIVYHPDFEAAAEKLAEHRRSHSGLTVETVNVADIYNEFASGKLDPAAIRDLVKMVYDRYENFAYCLLIGDGSFDSRDVYGLGGNFIPTYQTRSLNSIYAFPADDYFGVLNGSSAADPVQGKLNVSIGRLPVKTLEEAELSVDKIIHYDTSPKAFGDWRNRLVFVGDDEDSSAHTMDADEIAEKVLQNFPDFNVDKLFLDAYPQEATPAGDRFPAVNEAIGRSLYRGVLAMVYLGHGGPKGWAQERVLNIPDIRSWTNYDHLTLLVTATCSFTGYDDPSFVSAGEESFLNPNGGAVGLLTTTRPVYANENAYLTEVTLLNLFQRDNGKILTLGDAFRRGKNSNLSSGFTTNTRKFTLIGDPAMLIPVPNYGVATTAIDGKPVTGSQPDTLKALQKVTISGMVLDETGQPAANFNGLVYPTIYDKKLDVTTLGQDKTSKVITFKLQKSVLFKGKASVTNGQFQFTFVMPKDINFEFGKGKISYYAADPDQQLDAAGHYDGVVIGGTSGNALSDKEGPKVEVFMNSDGFAFGGITDKDPVLLVKLEDENGINVVGNSIGHDLEGVLDKNTQSSIVLNDFYEADTDDYTKGTVRYPMSALEEGRHQIRVSAWDVANNNSEGFTEFVVASSEGIALEHVLNFPNPFTDQTCFQFDHNFENVSLDVLVQIYTISGRLVKTIEASMLSDGALRRDDCIQWDGRDDYGDRLGRGVYLYKVKVRAPDLDLKGESDFSKLVILK